MSSHDDNQKSLILSTLVIVGTAASVFLLVQLGRVNRETIALPTPVVVADPARLADKESIPTRSRPALVRGRDDQGTIHPRLQYARWLESGLRKKNRTLSVRVAGPEHTILQLRWTADAVDREHMEQLKQAKGFYEKLRFLAFRKLELRVDDKIVWEEDI